MHARACARHGCTPHAWPSPSRSGRIAAHGEHHLECAPAYVEYACALLRKAQAEGDPFGGKIGKDKEAKPEGGAGAQIDEDDDDEEEGDAEGGEESEAEDLELAFQCFEVARLIYEKVCREQRSTSTHQHTGELLAM